MNCAYRYGHRKPILLQLVKLLVKQKIPKFLSQNMLLFTKYIKLSAPLARVCYTPCAEQFVEILYLNRNPRSRNRELKITTSHLNVEHRTFTWHFLFLIFTKKFTVDLFFLFSSITFISNRVNITNLLHMSFGLRCEWNQRGHSIKFYTKNR